MPQAGGIARQIVHTLAMKAVSATCRLILVVVLSRTLLPTDYGAYALVGTVGTFGVLLLGLNLFTYLYRAVPGRDATAQLRLFKATFLFEVAAAALVVAITIGTGILPAFLHLFKADGYEKAFGLGLLLLILLVALAEVTYFLQAQGRIEQANWVDFISQASWVLPFVTWWAIGLPSGLTTVLIAQICGCAAALVLGAYQIGLREWWSTPAQWSELGAGIAFSLPMIVPSFGFYVVKLADRFILSSYWGLKEVGIYSFASTFVNMLYTFTAWAVFNSFGPRIISAHNSGDNKRRDLLQTYMLKVSAVAFICGLIGLLTLYDPVVLAFARPEYRTASRVLPLLALSQIIIIFAYPAGNMLFMQSRVGLSAVIDMLGMAVAIIANLLLIPRWSYMGAATASALGFATIMVGKYFVSGALSALRFDVLFSVQEEARLIGDYYVRLRRSAE